MSAADLQPAGRCRGIARAGLPAAVSADAGGCLVAVGRPALPCAAALRVGGSTVPTASLPRGVAVRYDRDVERHERGPDRLLPAERDVRATALPGDLDGRPAVPSALRDLVRWLGVGWLGDGRLGDGRLGVRGIRVGRIRVGGRGPSHRQPGDGDLPAAVLQHVGRVHRLPTPAVPGERHDGVEGHHRLGRLGDDAAMPDALSGGGWRRHVPTVWPRARRIRDRVPGAGAEGDGGPGRLTFPVWGRVSGRSAGVAYRSAACL